MVTSPFAPFKNAVLSFQVSSGALVSDSNGNMRPGTAIVQVEALLQQKRDPNRKAEAGVDTSKIWLEGYLVKVLGAEPGRELKLPSVVTPDSLCSAAWQGRAGRFYLEFTADNPYLAALNIDLVNRVRGYFEPSSFVVADEPWLPTPPETVWAEIVEGQTLQANKGYWYNGLALGVMALPPSPSAGDRLILQRIGPANWRIAQRPGEQIQVFDLSTTLGEAGRVESVDQGASIEISFNGSMWVAIASSGNLEVV